MYGAEPSGFSLTEVMVGVAICALVVGAAAIALQSSLRTIRGSSSLSLGRDSNATGLALLRSDVVGGTQLLFRQGSSTDSDNLDGSRFQADMDACQALAGSTTFNPVFGIIPQNTDSPPVIYGLGLGLNGTTYSLRRCGSSVGGSSTPVLSTVIEGIAPVPCGDGRSACPSPRLDANGSASDLAAKLEALSNTLGADNTSPSRTEREPAFRFRTDASHRQLELIDATAVSDGIDSSFTSADPTGVSLRVPLYMTARVQSKESSPDPPSPPASCSTISLYGLPICGSRVYFILEGSESMGTCIVSMSPSTCLSTRMQIMQEQMRRILRKLPDTTMVLLVAYSGTGGINNRSWPANRVPVMIGSSGNRVDAITFIESLDDKNPRLWGADGNPWDAMDLAYNDPLAEAVFLIADDNPDVGYNRKQWNNGNSPRDAVDAFEKINTRRSKPLPFDSIAIGSDIDWQRLLSLATSGTYVRY